MTDYSTYIPNESKEIKDLVNQIFNHPLITGENKKWIMHRDSFREGFADGGCIDFYDLETSILQIVYLIKKLKQYKPKTILEVGMNVGSFALVCKLTLKDVKVFSVEKQTKFQERQKQINDFFNEELINTYWGYSDSTLCRNWINKRTYDLAWIDGKHDKITCMFDIMSAYNSNIPIIMCDNSDEHTGVKSAINKLEKFTSLKEIEYREDHCISILEKTKNKSNIVFAYDRKENDIFVPNGYPQNFEYIEDTELYKNTFAKEKVVHNLFREFQTNQQLIDNIDDKFIYPVEQFGAFDKLIGRDKLYEDFCFLKHIRKSTLKKLQSGQGKIVILALEESRVELQEMIYFHKLISEYKIKHSDVYYVIGNNWSLKNQYDKWSKNNGVNIVNSFEQLYLKGYDWFTKEEQKITFVENSSIVSSRDRFRPHRFVCFNRRIRPHRYALIAMLYHNNLLKNNLVSFSLEQGKDLNHLNQEGKPDLHTMTTICGKTKLRDYYMEHHSDLLHMSPQTIDYENLTNIQGPGHENREPYENSYFSIVSETAFPEPTYFSTEKIFRPMLHFHPFIVYGSPYTLKNLQELGFKTFNGFIDESYDNVLSPFKRMQIITREVKRLCSMDKIDLHNWYYDMHDILLHNRELMKEYGVLYKESQKKIFEDIYEL